MFLAQGMLLRRCGVFRNPNHTRQALSEDNRSREAQLIYFEIEYYLYLSQFHHVA